MVERNKPLLTRFIPRVWHLRWQLREIGAKYRPQIDQARSTKDREQAEYLEHTRQWESEMIRDEMEVIYTSRLVRQARRMRLPNPSHPTISQTLNGTQDENWYLSKLIGEWILTTAGYASLSKEMKKEQRERIQVWSSVIALLIGFVGVVVALVALLISR